MLKRNHNSWRTFVILALLTAALPACGASAETPAPTLTGPQLLFADDFSNTASGWLESADGEASQGYRDGRFFFEVRVPDLIVWDNPGLNFKDFGLQVTARQVSGGPDNSYGVLFRYIDEGNFYRFDLTGDGGYAVLKSEHNEWATLADWRQSAHIKPLGEENRIRVVCQGDEMVLYVNGQQLVSVEDDSFERGDVGLFASTFSDPNVEVAFDDLEIWEIGHE